MRVVAVLIVVLLAVIACRVPTAREIGEEILNAQERRVRERQMAIYEMNRKDEEAAKKQQAAKAAASAAAERQREKDRAQEEFDALPKWDVLARPINREPPPGLSPTAAIPPPPPTPKRTPTPAEQAAEVARKFGAKP